MKNRVKIIFTDLDGTLLNSERTVTSPNFNCLEKLGQHKIYRVIATGRSLFSFEKVISSGFPADFLIFSTGAGIIDLNTKKLLHSSSLKRTDITYISNYLIDQKADFMVHHTVPDNHYFTYYGDTTTDTDFTRRLQIYQDYARKYDSASCLPHESAQIIAVFPDDLSRFNAVKKNLNGYQVTRTTSPLDGKSIWMEIYPHNVSKGRSAKWLCDYLQINQSESFGIGNDFNDISLLDFTEHSYIVANGPVELQRKYRSTRSNNEDGFCQAVNMALQ